ncbi:hypothetical protein V1505DRAFT_380703, partial [Lipomyces doorenjongii]
MFRIRGLVAVLIHTSSVLVVLLYSMHETCQADMHSIIETCQADMHSIIYVFIYQISVVCNDLTILLFL